MTEKVLYVDDDANILAAYRRSLRGRFDVFTAQGGQEGLELVKAEGPFAVVLSDMNMPGMNGLQFLSTVHELSPETVCMMLTGQADLQTAIQAVNEGHIFRFLTKPCPRETFIGAVEAGIKQHRLVVAEKDLLNRTLTGSIRVLTEILGLVNPTAFSRATRVRRYVKHMVGELRLRPAWQYEIAAMLSQIGCVTLPPETLNKLYANKKLSEKEQEMFSSHPAIGGKLLANIPRLELIAKMIERQQQPYGEQPPADPTKPEGVVSMGAQMLRVALDFDALLARGLPREAALKKMRDQPDQYNPLLLDTLKTVATGQLESSVDGTLQEVTVWQLEVGMYAYEDILACNGILLVPRWQEITEPLIIRLRNFACGVGVREPFRVISPRRRAGEPLETARLGGARA